MTCTGLTMNLDDAAVIMATLNARANQLQEDKKKYQDPDGLLADAYKRICNACDNLKIECAAAIERGSYVCE